jgi:hypothetical protein
MTNFVQDEKLLLSVTVTQSSLISSPSSPSTFECTFEKYIEQIAIQNLRFPDGTQYFGPVTYGKVILVEVVFRQIADDDSSLIRIPGFSGVFHIKNKNLTRLPTSASSTAPPTSTKIEFKKGDLVRLVGCGGEAARKKLAHFYGDRLFAVLGPLIGRVFFVEEPLCGSKESADYYECRLDAKNGDEYQFHVDWLELVCADFESKKQQAQSDLDEAIKDLGDKQKTLQDAQRFFDACNAIAADAQAAVARCRENMKQFS